MNGLLAGLKSLGAIRLVAMAAVAIGMFATLAVLATHGGSSPMTPLYGDLDLKDAAAIVDQLDADKIPTTTDQGGSRVLVASSQLDAARLALAKAGLPSGGTVGWEIFDKSTDMLTESQFQQNINQTRALEGELSRTIALIDGIRAARVNLVLPSREAFSHDQQDASASVLLTTKGAGSVDRESVRAILNLVAAAVPGLKTQNVAIVDSAGNLLARAGEPLDGVASAQSGDELRTATEARLAQAVEEMLGRTLGPDHVRAQASVEMNFDTSQQTTEKYDPDQQVARSTQTTTTSTKTTDATPTVSVQNNLPNAGAATSGSGTTEQHQEETDNYEIGKTVSTLVHDQPEISRISLAVMVDGTMVPGVGGKSEWQPLSADQLASITNLVKSAIGFNDARGDKVDVISMPFLSDEAPETPALKFAGLEFEKSDLMRLAETGLVGLLVLAGLLFVVRPTLLKLVATPTHLVEIGSETASASMLPGSPQAARLPGAAGGLPALAYSEPDAEDLVTVANIEGQLRASSIRRLSSMVDKDPDATLSIIRGWIMAEQN